MLGSKVTGIHNAFRKNRIDLGLEHAISAHDDIMSLWNHPLCVCIFVILCQHQVYVPLVDDCKFIEKVKVCFDEGTVLIRVWSTRYLQMMP